MSKPAPAKGGHARPEPAKPSAAAPSAPAPESGAHPGTRSREETKRRRREQQQTRNRLSKVEAEIQEFEARLKELESALAHPPSGDWEKLHALVNEDQELRARLERRYREWERLTESLGDTAPAD